MNQIDCHTCALRKYYVYFQIKQNNMKGSCSGFNYIHHKQ